MKKFLSFMALGLLLASNYLAAEAEFFEDEQVVYANGRGNGQQKTVDCATCCQNGRFTSPECAAQCNKCEIGGSDESIDEAHDFPN